MEIGLVLAINNSVWSSQHGKINRLGSSCQPRAISHRLRLMVLVKVDT